MSMYREEEIEEEINELIVRMENRGWEFHSDDSRTGVFFRMTEERREREGCDFRERHFYDWDCVAQYIRENKPLDDE